MGVVAVAWWQLFLGSEQLMAVALPFDRTTGQLLSELSVRPAGSSSLVLDPQKSSKSQRLAAMVTPENVIWAVNNDQRT
jgi:hypothetical protein